VPAAETCLVCGSVFGSALLDLPGPHAITSLGHLIEADTTVFLCAHCSHTQTRPLEAVSNYYDANYNIRTETEDEDDLYEVRDKRAVYRSEHQARIVVDRHADLLPGARILDFGCAKAASLRQIISLVPDARPHVYDVSANYGKFWDAFVPSENQAVHKLRPEWNAYFDLVLSFFALEHTPNPRDFVSDLARIIRPGGKLHIVFPNMYANFADMIVVDHVNHFSAASIRALFAGTQLRILTIDSTLHKAAFVVIAQREANAAPTASVSADVEGSLHEAKAIAEFWSGARQRLLTFEATDAGHRAVVYGSGVYGMFITTNLKDAARICYFLDQNPHQQTKTLLGKRVVAPSSIGDDIDTIYVGLNPHAAKSIIESVKALRQRERHYFFF